MVKIPRIHCHSAFKHYHMYHSGHDSSYGSVFNTTYNFNGGTMCGGGFMGGLWGGLGMGLGAGLMNLFGGLFGGGMGFGFPMGGIFGGGSRHTDGAGSKEKEVKTKTKVVEKECNDPDRAKLNELNAKELKLESDLKNKKEGSINTLKHLYEDAIAAQKASESDKHHTDSDKIEYETLIARLTNLAHANGLEVKDGKLIESKPSQPAQPVDNSQDGKVQPDEQKPQPVVQQSDETQPHKYEYNGKTLTNVDEKDLAKLLKEGAKLDIIDTSDAVDDMEDREVLEYNSSSHVLSIKDKNGIKYLKYKYQGKNESGELVFKSNKNGQEYILQKDSTGELYLMQYEDQDGHDVPDVTNDNKAKNNDFDV